jgi:nucleotidyltransferase substrate binding protein (TIGR01987 family)
MGLDLSSLGKAAASLERAIARSLDAPVDEELRDAVIQRFEYTFELSWKFIQRWIRRNASPEDAEPRTRKDLFRTAARFELIDDPYPWFEYGDARNIVAHTYDEERAKEVYEVALRFSHDALYLLNQLENRND